LRDEDDDGFERDLYPQKIHETIDVSHAADPQCFGIRLDFSAPSLEAIEAALPLIKHFGADLHLVHVFEPDYPASSMVAIPLAVP
jgi:nucleotide-binding universal stress UspA family protein